MSGETSYRGEYAAFYDLIYADKPYQHEAGFVMELLREAGPAKHVLELACGTGTMAGLLSERGLDVVGLDWSESMLTQARAKFPALSFRQGDMRNLDVPGRPFDAVLCLFDSIGYLQHTEDIVRVMESARGHLRSGGRFVFDFWHAPAILAHFDPVRVRRWATPDGELLRVSETSLRVAQALADVDYTLFIPQRGGDYRRLNERQTNRYFLVEEMRGLVTRAGLEALAFYDGYTRGGVISDQTWHVVCEANAP